MDEPVPIEGIIEGEPHTLAVVCAAGGSAIVAYCTAVGANAYVADTVVTALANFRRGVVENADQEPAQLEHLLLTVTAAAARDIAGVEPSPMQHAAARFALEGAVTGPLTPGLAPRIIRALVEAAPVVALSGDAAAVRRATEQHYIRMFDGQHAPAPPPLSGAPPAPAASWIPQELDGVAAEPAPFMPPAPFTPPAPTTPPPAPFNPPAPTSPADGPFEPIAPVSPPDGPFIPSPPASFSPAPPPAPEARAPAPAPPAEHAPAAAGPAPPVPRPTIGDWMGRSRSQRRRQKTAHGGARVRSVVAATVVGVAIGVAIGIIAKPEKSPEPNTILVRTLDTPFTVDGAAFNVARTRTANWALAIRSSPPRPGWTWVTLAAQTRNISRAIFHPRALGYRLRTASGFVIGPETARVPSALTAAGGRLAVGERSSVHLGFQVPSAQPGLTLEFDPGPRAPRVRVPLN